MNLHQFWKAFTDLGSHSAEPQVKQRRDSHGKLYYQLYDPLTHKLSTFGSEHEIRILLDQRRY